MFHDKMTDFGKALALGREGVDETFTMDPPVNQGQQHDQNPDLDHHWLPPSDSQLCSQDGTQAPVSHSWFPSTVVTPA